jgi:hypothetical protein
MNKIESYFRGWLGWSHFSQRPQAMRTRPVSIDPSTSVFSGVAAARSQIFTSRYDSRCQGVWWALHYEDSQDVILKFRTSVRRTLLKESSQSTEYPYSTQLYGRLGTDYQRAWFEEFSQSTQLSGRLGTDYQCAWFEEFSQSTEHSYSTQYDTATLGRQSAYWARENVIRSLGSAVRVLSIRTVPNCMAF